jgi:predicted alpha/beta superfamily hydrolase
MTAARRRIFTPFGGLGWLPPRRAVRWALLVSACAWLGPLIAAAQEPEAKSAPPRPEAAAAKPPGPPTPPKSSAPMTEDKSPLPGITGEVRKHPAFPATNVAPRNVHVWLPPSYEKEPNRRYAVIYAHDGQNLFDPKTSFVGVDWGVDEALTELISARKVREAIVVGIWNTPKRLQEYLPQKAVWAMRETPRWEKLKEDLGRFGTQLETVEWLSDAYLRFLVRELKPFIDREYRTRRGREDTFMMGSSAGALISLYAVSEYPDVYGGAACVSIHWPIADGMMIEYIQDKLPDPATHRIYFDFGTETLDKNYEEYQARMDPVMQRRGYQSGVNWLTRKFPGADHSERSWRARVHVPLEFLLGRVP